MLLADFKDYEIISMSEGEKLERWGNYYLLRPDPEIIWKDKINKSIVHAHYHRSNKGGGYWEKLKKLSDRWTVNYKNLTFNVKLMGFKHTGIFPEQSVNWDFMMNKIEEETKKGNRVKVLNLFAYTGCASVACLSKGAEVVHVDSSKGMIDWAKENVKSSNLEDKPIRFLVDDCVKFVKREIRRGNKYDAIIMDPPSYGRGSKNEVWDIEKDLFDLVELCMQILTDDPLFFIINSYTAGLSPTVIENILKMFFNKKTGTITSGELGIKAKNGLILPAGVYGRYER
ncbi:MAG: class I SAM-dependent methyltransferase [Bacilli bacterium]|nr:class I SAM-dependent methyltransferase [Bacilli bacterium]